MRTHALNHPLTLPLCPEHSRRPPPPTSKGFVASCLLQHNREPPPASPLSPQSSGVPCFISSFPCIPESTFFFLLPSDAGNIAQGLWAIRGLCLPDAMRSQQMYYPFWWQQFSALDLHPFAFLSLSLSRKRGNFICFVVLWGVVQESIYSQPFSLPSDAGIIAQGLWAVHGHLVAQPAVIWIHDIPSDGNLVMIKKSTTPRYTVGT